MIKNMMNMWLCMVKRHKGIITRFGLSYSPLLPAILTINGCVELF